MSTFDSSLSVNSIVMSAVKIFGLYGPADSGRFCLLERRDYYQKRVNTCGQRESFKISQVCVSLAKFRLPSMFIRNLTQKKTQI